MSNQEQVSKETKQEENQILCRVDKNVSNRISIDKIQQVQNNLIDFSQNDTNKCYCCFQFSSDSKQQKCQAQPKCMFDNPLDIHQNKEIVLFLEGDKASFQHWDLNKKIIDAFRDYNYSKDASNGGKAKLKLNYKASDLEKSDLNIIINQKYKKIAYQLEQCQNNLALPIQNLKKEAINIQEQIENIMLGETSIQFYFSQYQSQFETIHQTLSFLQQANQQEIEASISDEYCSSTQKTQQMYTKLKKDQIKISLVSILKNYVDFQPNDKENLQCINLYYEADQQLKKKKKNTSKFNYDVFFDETFESLKVALKYFLKDKISQFRPNIIVFQFLISNPFINDPMVFYKLIRAFNKISQGKLIIIPYIEIQTATFKKEIEQIYMKCVNCCLQGLLKKQKVQKVDANLTIEFYEKLHPWFCESAAIKKMYQSQLRALRIQKKKVETEQQKQYQTRDFPLIDNDGNLCVIDLQFEYNPQTSQYFVEYNKIEIEEYDGIIIIIEQHVIYVITFKEQEYGSNKKTLPSKKYKITQKLQFPLPDEKIKDNVYYFDAEKLLLMSFFGFEIQSQQWCSDVYTLKILQMEEQWKKITFHSLAKKCNDENYIYEQNAIMERVSSRKQFTVTQNSITGDRNQNCYLCLGGTYFDDEYRYGCIIQEVQIDFNRSIYATKILQKQKVEKYYKEGPNPLVMRMSDIFLIYFEGNGNFENSNFNPSIQKISLWKSNKYLVNSHKVTINEDKGQNNFCQLYQYFKSNQKNVRQILLQEQVERSFAFKIVIQDVQTKANQTQERIRQQNKFHILTFYFSQSSQCMNQVRIESKQFLVSVIIPPKTLPDIQKEDTSGLFINSVDNLNNNFIFHYNEVSQYILCYIDMSTKPTFKRIMFNDNKNYETSSEYDEIIQQDWVFQKVYIVRKVYHKQSCDLCFYECPNINFQDVKDLSENVLCKVPINLRYTIPNVKMSNYLIGINVESREPNSFEALILTNKQQIKIVNQKGQFNHTQKKQQLYLSMKLNFILFKTYLPTIQYCIFQTTFYFTQALVNKVTQNILEIKYVLLDNNTQYIYDGVLKYFFNEPLPITGLYEGKINNIKNLNERMEIQILVNHDDVITHRFVHCQINENTKQLELLKYNQEAYLNKEGCQMFQLTTPHKRIQEYVIRKQGGQFIFVH